MTHPTRMVRPFLSVQLRHSSCYPRYSGRHACLRIDSHQRHASLPMRHKRAHSLNTTHGLLSNPGYSTLPVAEKVELVLRCNALQSTNFLNARWSPDTYQSKMTYVHGCRERRGVSSTICTSTRVVESFNFHSGYCEIEVCFGIFTMSVVIPKLLTRNRQRSARTTFPRWE